MKLAVLSILAFTSITSACIKKPTEAAAVKSAPAPVANTEEGSDEEGSIGCTLQGGEGPFESIHLTLGSELEMSVEWTNAAHAADDAFIQEVRLVDSPEVMGDVYSFGDGNDWGGGSLILHGIEDGKISGFVTWSSDTNEMAGYYSCQRND